MWTLDIIKGDAVVKDTYRLTTPNGQVLTEGHDIANILRQWHQTRAPLLAMQLGDVTVYCMHIPEMT